MKGENLVVDCGDARAAPLERGRTEKGDLSSHIDSRECVVERAVTNEVRGSSSEHDTLSYAAG